MAHNQTFLPNSASDGICLRFLGPISGAGPYVYVPLAKAAALGRGTGPRFSQGHSDRSTWAFDPSVRSYS